MRFCEECGSQLEDGAQFCEECGAVVEPLIEIDNAVLQPQIDGNSAKTAENNIQEPLQSGAAEAPEKRREKKASAKTLAFIAILCIVTLAGGMLLVFKDSIFGKAGSNKGKNTNTSASMDKQPAENMPDKEISPVAETTPVVDAAAVTEEIPTPTRAVEPTPTAVPVPTEMPVPTENPPLYGNSCFEQYWAADLDYDTGYFFYDSDCRYLEEADLYGLTAEECKLARNEIYARYGRKFTTKSIQEHFDSCYWYYPVYEASEFNEAWLNEYEKANIDMIKAYEDSNAPETSRYFEPSVIRRVSFTTWSELTSDTVILEYTSEHEGRMIYYLFRENPDGEWYDYKCSYRFVEDDNMVANLYDLDTDELVMGYEIFYKTYNGDSYFTMDIYYDGDELELIETKWALANVG